MKRRLAIAAILMGMLLSGCAMHDGVRTATGSNSTDTAQRLIPSAAVQLSVGGYTGASLTPEDRLRVVGTVADGRQRLRVMQVPRATMSWIGLVLADDGSLDGRIVYFETAWSLRSRLTLVAGRNATAEPADVRFLAPEAP